MPARKNRPGKAGTPAAPARARDLRRLDDWSFWHDLDVMHLHDRIVEHARKAFEADLGEPEFPVAFDEERVVTEMIRRGFLEWVGTRTVRRVRP